MQTSDTKPRLTLRARAAMHVAAGLLVVLAATISYLAISERQVALPRWVADHLERMIDAELGIAGSLMIGRASMSLDRFLTLHIVLDDAGLLDANGSEIVRLESLAGELSPASIIAGTDSIRRIALSGARINVVRQTDGEFDFSVGAGDVGTLAGALEVIDGVFASGPLSRLERVDADRMAVTLEDRRSGRVWRVAEGSATLDHDAQGLDLALSADVSNEAGELASVAIGLQTEKGTTGGRLNVMFENAAAPDIALQSPALAFLGALDAPVSGDLVASVDADGSMARLSASLRAGAGFLRPTADAESVKFEMGRAYFDYDPETRTIYIDEISFETATARGSARGRATLTDLRDGWPSALLGQLSIGEVSVQAEGLLAETAAFDSGSAEFRLRLDPFALDIGQLALQADERSFRASGRFAALPAGWDASLDLSLDAIAVDGLLALWPVSLAPGTRKWLIENVMDGNVRDLTAAWRRKPGSAPKFSATYSFENANIRYLKTLPPISEAAGYASVHDAEFALVLESGEVSVPPGGRVDLTGSAFRVGDTGAMPARAEIGMRLDGPIPVMLSLLDMEPFEFLSSAGMSADLANGRARIEARLTFDLLENIRKEDLSFDIDGVLNAVSSDKLAPGHGIFADEMRIEADLSGIAISGAGRFGAAPFDMTWSQRFGPDDLGRSRIEGTFALGQAFLEEFGVAIPEGGVVGEALAHVTAEIERDVPARFRLTSDLVGLELRLPALGWSKPLGETGRLAVAGSLGAVPKISSLSFDASGLYAEGHAETGEDGMFKAIRFDRLRAGDWLDISATLTGGSPDAAPEVSVSGGTLDLRKADFGAQARDAGRAVPVLAALDRVTVSDGIALHDFRGRFAAGHALDGEFTANVNGRSAIEGVLSPVREGTSIRISSEQAGQLAADVGILRNARDGNLDMTLAPTGERGVYEGVLEVRQTVIVDAPILAEMLSAISILGVLEQLNSGGILFSETHAEFRLGPDSLTLHESSAVGASLGLSLDGTYDLKEGSIDMQGVLSPVYFLNAAGQVLSRGREGLFGFKFSLKGPGDEPRVRVNLLSILTPGALRELFRRPRVRGEAAQ